jgi:hypothetical protein
MTLSADVQGRKASDPAPGSRCQTGWWSRIDLLAVLLFLLILGRCGQELRIGCPDFFFHVKTGERIVRERRIIWRDDFSHTANGRVCAPQNWLFDAGEYLLYSRLGMDGVILGIGILAAAGVTLLYWMLRYSLGLWPVLALSLAWLFWGVWAGTVTLLRPRLFETLGLLVVVCAAANWTRGRGRTMLWLPLFFVLWANVHSSFVYGIAVCLWFLTSELLRTWLAQRGDRGIRARLKTLGLCIAACVVATFASAAHYHAYAHAAVFILWKMEWTPLIMEWQPWRVDGHSLEGYILVALIASVCLGRRPVSLFWTVLLAGTFWYALLHRRFVSMFVVVALPVLGMQLQSWFAHLEETVPLLSPAARWRNWLQRTILAPGLTQTRLYPVVVCLVTGAAAIALWPVLPRGRTIRNCTTPGDYPFVIADTVWRYDVPGHMLNKYGHGAYLVFRLWPKQRVFVDGRDRLYGDKICFDASDAMNGNENWRELFREYDITFVIAGPDAGVAPKLDADPDWVLAQRAQTHRLYLKRCKLNEDVLRRMREDGLIQDALPLRPRLDAHAGPPT